MTVPTNTGLWGVDSSQSLFSPKAAHGTGVNGQGALWRPAVTGHSAHLAGSPISPAALSSLCVCVRAGTTKWTVEFIQK